MKKVSILCCIVLLLLACGNKSTSNPPYVMEVTTFTYSPNVDETKFWEEDAKVENDYTSKQAGFISRESGFDNSSGRVIVVVRWQSLKDAEASMQKFMGDASVQTYAGMIHGPSMEMTRYEIR